MYNYDYERVMTQINNAFRVLGIAIFAQFSGEEMPRRAIRRHRKI
jgi:hypothetical protein